MKKKKRLPAWPGRGRPNAEPFGWCPGQFLPRGRPEAGGRQAHSATCPAQQHPRPAQGRGKAGSSVSLRSSLPGSVPARPGCWPGCLPRFSLRFLLQRLLFGATYKRGFFPIFSVDLIPYSLSSIANILRARFLLIPPMILAQI